MNPSNQPPTISDWCDTLTIVNNFEYITDDSPYPIATQKPIATRKGLLSYLMEETDIPPVSSKSLRASKLKQSSAIFASSKDSILRLIPDAEELGNTRDERIESLKSRCARLPAISWLNSQTSYEAVLATIETLGSRQRKVSYQSDAIEFHILEVIAKAFIFYTGRVNDGKDTVFPGREDIRNAMKASAELNNFLKTYAMPSSLNPPLGFRDSLDDFHNRLVNIERRYSKPRFTNTTDKRLFCEDVITGLLRKINECSPTLTRNICGLVGYEIDLKDLNTLIQEKKNQVEITYKTVPVGALRQFSSN